MISNQVLQSTILGLKEITGVDMAVIDVDGNILAATSEDGAFTGLLPPLEEFIRSETTEISGKNVLLFKVYDEQVLMFMVAAKGSGSETRTVGRIAAFQIGNLLVAYKERFDKENFIKNLLLDNLLLVDIYNRSQKLRIPMDDRRVVIIAENPVNMRTNLTESIRALLANRKNDFVTAVDENSIIVVFEVGREEGYEAVAGIAEKIYQVLAKEKDETLHVAYGTIVGELREVSRSYKEAKMALDVGRIFYGEEKIFAYSELGIGRLIYQLPIPLCKMFIQEIFEGRSPDDFDEETITTINRFFENSLNVSETSRQLFIHRNTLVYRLDKLEKLTGLDIRVFEDAITFKIALMVVKYMKYMEEQ
ncbi:MAG: helix-turn-helix domain-containing protein [Lachnospiraceae bacterium]|nr:helix-turn-helix domain-containing protein [Lachnospiraceae bacterium]